MKKGTVKLVKTEYEINFDNDHPAGSSAGLHPVFWDGEKWISINEANKSIDPILTASAQKYVEDSYYETHG